MLYIMHFYVLPLQNFWGQRNVTKLSSKQNIFQMKN